MLDRKYRSDFNDPETTNLKDLCKRLKNNQFRFNEINYYFTGIIAPESTLIRVLGVEK